jgi:hypothetical protein
MLFFGALVGTDNPASGGRGYELDDAKRFAPRPAT